MLYFKRFLLAPLALTALAITLTACGGGDDSDSLAAKDGVVASCKGTDLLVTAPTLTQISGYTGTYSGLEGSYDGANGAGNFTQSGTATLVVNSNGAITYKGKAYTPSSVCLDKVGGLWGKVLYITAGQGNFQVTLEDDSWGLSPDGITWFKDGVKLKPGA